MATKKTLRKKLWEARIYASKLEIVKDGKNAFAKYDYFTPALTSYITNLLEEKFEFVFKFDLVQDDHGYNGVTTILDIDSDESISFEMRTEKPEIKATNATQKMGGMFTYVLRYSQLNVFGIADSSNDFNSKVQEPKAKEDLNPGHFKWAAAATAVKNGNTTIAAIRKNYQLTEENEKLLTAK